jgi:hypothetical protein
MLSEPRVDVTFAPTEQPGSGNMQPWRDCQRVAQVFLYGFRTASKHPAQFIYVKQFQGMVPKKRFFGTREGVCRQHVPLRASRQRNWGV